MANFIAFTFVGIAAVSPIFSTIRYRQYIYEPGTPNELKERASKLSTWFLLSAGVLFFGGMLYESIIPDIKSWFFDGHFVKEQVLTEPDEGTPFYETKEFFKFSPYPDTNLLGAFTFLVIFWFAGLFAMCYYFHSQYERKKESIDNELDKKVIIGLSVLKIVMGIALVICLLQMPYGYYRVIRWAIFIGCIYLIMEPHKRQFFIGYIFLVCMMILFNPIVEINLTRIVWNVIDVVFAAILFASAIKRYIDSRDMV